MIALKKVYGDELLRIALVLSLLRADPNAYLRQDVLQLTAGLNASNGTWSPDHETRTVTRPPYVHPKSLDNVLLQYERNVFAELNSLGRYPRPSSNYGDFDTICVNNFVECRAAQVLQNNSDNPADDSAAAAFGVSDDDNVAGEVHLGNSNDTTPESDQHKPNDDIEDVPTVTEELVEAASIPDVVTFTNVTDNSTDLFDRWSLDAKQFDVADFFAAPSNMLVKKEETHKDEMRLKVESNDFFDTGDSFFPHYFEKLKKYGGFEDDSSVFDQNLSDLRDYAETVESLESFRRGFEQLDVKEHVNDLEKYLLENTQIDLEKYGGFSFELGVKRERASTSFTASSSGASETDSGFDIKAEGEDEQTLQSGDELTQEDMDLIEVLWKQDVDMGFSLENPVNLTPVDVSKVECTKDPPPVSSAPMQPDEISKLKQKLISDACSASSVQDVEGIESGNKDKSEMPAPDDDPWAGLSYTIDTETGEYIIQGDLPSSLVSGSDAEDNARFDLLEEALQLVGLEEATSTATNNTTSPKTVEVKQDDDELLYEAKPDVNALPFDKSQVEEVGTDRRGEGEETGGVMLHPGVSRAGGHHGPPPPPPHHHHTPPHHPHHTLHQHYHHQSLVRQMSMEQRWQDLASLLAITPPESQHHLNHTHHLNHLNHLNHTHQPYHHHTYGPAVTNHHPYSAQHGGAPPTHLGPPAVPYSGAYGPPLPAPPPADKTDIYAPTLVDHQPPQPVYKTPVSSSGGPGGPHHHEAPSAPHPHDAPIYYQNSTSDINGTSDGFLSSILNDEDLQLMDMAVNEGMYTMRMLDGSVGQQPQSGNVPIPVPHQYASNQPPAHPHPHHGYASLAPNVGHHIASTHVNMGSERIDSSSDSAVSSMGSERVPSLSDGEWCDGGSDSAQEYDSSKFRPYNSYGRTGTDNLPPTATANNGQLPPQRHTPPVVAQKKHHMFGKRCFQEQSSPILDPVAEVPPPRDIKYEFDHSQMPYGPNQDNCAVATPTELKYSCTLEFAAANAATRPGSLTNLPTPLLPLGVSLAERTRVAHNHTYGAPPEHAGGLQPRPQVRDKRARRMTDDSDCSGSGGSSMGSHMTRDEKRAKALGIPMPVHEIINLPMDEFNERLSKHDLSEAQLSLIRDIRRRGKNKVAAQNCRKRKLEQITSLEDEVRNVRDRKTRLQRERMSLTTDRQRIKDHFTMLYHHVFQHLRDADGNPLSSHQYSLQQAADGAVVLVPRAQPQMAQGAHNMQGPNGLRQSIDDDHHNMTRTSDDELEQFKSKQQRKSFDP